MVESFFCFHQPLYPSAPTVDPLPQSSSVFLLILGPEFFEVLVDSIVKLLAENISLHWQLASHRIHGSRLLLLLRGITIMLRGVMSLRRLVITVTLTTLCIRGGWLLVRWQLLVSRLAVSVVMLSWLTIISLVDEPVSFRVLDKPLMIFTGFRGMRVIRSVKTANFTSTIGDRVIILLKPFEDLTIRLEVSFLVTSMASQRHFWFIPLRSFLFSFGS